MRPGGFDDANAKKHCTANMAPPRRRRWAGKFNAVRYSAELNARAHAKPFASPENFAYVCLFSRAAQRPEQRARFGNPFACERAGSGVPINTFSASASVVSGRPSRGCTVSTTTRRARSCHQQSKPCHVRSRVDATPPPPDAVSAPETVGIE